MLDVRRFKAKQEGPAICFLSGIYGDEVCGTIAINRLISDIENKTINLVRGEIYLISRVNQKAYAEKKHFCDVDLNRVCKKKS